MLKKNIPDYLLFFLILLFVISCGNEQKSKKEDLTMKASVIEVSIGGMTCTGCEQKIQAGVSKLDGIKSIKASHLAANAVIEYYPALVDTLRIREAITGTGYTVKKFMVSTGN